MKIFLAFILAALVPALFITAGYLYSQFTVFETDDPYIWVRTSSVLAWSALVSSGYVLLLGMPVYFLLRGLRAVSGCSTIGSGFILGAVPVAIFTWPLKYPLQKISASSNGVQTMVDGVPTMAGWFEFIYGVSFFGVCGAVGALVFWLVAAPNKSFKDAP